MIAARADDLRSRGMACILLWMQGGAVAVRNVQPQAGPRQRRRDEGDRHERRRAFEIAENLPHCAKAMNDLAIIRSMTSKEGNHQRATYLLHHGYLPMASVKHPTLGANVAHQIGDAASELPSFVQIGGRLPQLAAAAGSWASTTIRSMLQSATRPPQDTTPSAGADRYARRLRLLESMQGDFAAAGGAQVVADQQQADQAGRPT